MTLEGKVKLARDLRRQAFSLGEIAKMLGGSKSTVKNCLDDYPYHKGYPLAKQLERTDQTTKAT